MDKKGNVISIDLGETHNYSEVADNFQISALEYEKKVLTYIMIGSGVSVISIMTFANSSPDVNQYLNSMIISLWCFVLALLIAGTNLFVVALGYGAQHNQYRASGNKQDKEKALQIVLERTRGHEDNNKIKEVSVEKLKDDIKSFNEVIESNRTKATKYDKLTWWLLIASFLLFLSGLVLPLLKITCIGKLYG